MPARPDGPLRAFRAAKTAKAWGGLALQSLLMTSRDRMRLSRDGEAMSW